jgi:hypothetical protein
MTFLRPFRASHLVGLRSLGLKPQALLLRASGAEGDTLSINGEQLTFRQLFRRQAERLAHAFMDNAQYEPFVLPC